MPLDFRDARDPVSWSLSTSASTGSTDIFVISLRRSSYEYWRENYSRGKNSTPIVIAMPSRYLFAAYRKDRGGGVSRGRANPLVKLHHYVRIARRYKASREIQVTLAVRSANEAVLLKEPFVVTFGEDLKQVFLLPPLSFGGVSGDPKNGEEEVKKLGASGVKVLLPTSDFGDVGAIAQKIATDGVAGNSNPRTDSLVFVLDPHRPNGQSLAGEIAYALRGRYKAVLADECLK